MQKHLSPWAYQALKTALVSAFLLSAATQMGSCQAQTAPVIQDGDRVIFVGDSITGQGVNAGQGWTRLLDEALQHTRAAGKPTLTALGGSGQGAGTWLDVESRSRTQHFNLDVPNVDVKDTLDKPANVLVIMLGMNDVLAPRLTSDAAGYDNWAQDYRRLIAALRERLHPRALALATIPVCTEDPNSPKNKAIAALNLRVAQIAEEEKGVVLPTNKSLWSMLQTGRTLRPDFHVTYDFVHPNDAGHLAIATGMLQGLGEPEAAQFLNQKYLPPLWKLAAPALPRLAYELESALNDPNSETQNFKLHYRWTSALPGETASKTVPTVRLTLPAGWKADALTSATPTGVFSISGKPDRWKNALVLETVPGIPAPGTQTQKVQVDVPPSWLIGTANTGRVGWSADGASFDPAQGQQLADDSLIKGEGWRALAQVAPGVPLTWNRWTPTVNYLGGDKPGSVDMAGVTFFQNFESAYGIRWVYSGRDRTVQCKVGSHSFGDNSHLSLWLNGQSIFAGQLAAHQGEIVESQLRKGWNALVFKSNHWQWQWHFSIDLVESPQDDLDDLRFSIVAPR